MIANTPAPPYYAVIFTTLQREIVEGYVETANRMEELAKQQTGFLGLESVRSNIGITVSYWENLEAITKWKNNLEHSIARDKGRKLWYKKYHLRICKVERDYDFEK